MGKLIPSYLSYSNIAFQLFPFNPLIIKVEVFDINIFQFM